MGAQRQASDQLEQQRRDAAETPQIIVVKTLTGAHEDQGSESPGKREVGRGSRRRRPTQRF